MSRFNSVFVRPVHPPLGGASEFEGSYLGNDIILFDRVRYGDYVYCNETVFVEDGKGGQIIPAISLASSEAELMVRTNGYLKNPPLNEIRVFAGFIKKKPFGWGKNKIYFYNAEDMCENITGGWDTGINTGSGGITINGNNVYFNVYVPETPDTAPVEKAKVTSNPINLSRIKTLYVDWEKIGSSYSGAILVFAVSADKKSKYTASVVYRTTSTRSRIVSSLDVSEITGSYYIKMSGVTQSNHESQYLRGYVYSIWAEML